MARLEDNSKEKLTSIEQALLEALNEVGITEVAYKDCKTLLNLGKCQSVHFAAQIASLTLTMMSGPSGSGSPSTVKNGANV